MSNGSWLPEEDFKGLSDNFFDNLIDPNDDFSLEDIETADDEGDWDAGFQNLVPPPLDVLTSLSSEFSCNGQRVPVQKPVPSLKQSCSSEASTVDNSPPDVKVSKLFQSSSPVSVLESTNGSVSSLNLHRALKLAFPVKGIRNKRKRPTLLRVTFLQAFGFEMSQQFAPDESESEINLSSEISANKKRKRNKSRPTHQVHNTPKPFHSGGRVQKCTHCETTNTPQWREGPSGPKTLCNACGVRFRSGRLVPEYRPASSPTFIPTVHSNMHRKIIQMRSKDEGQFDTRKIRAVTSRAETKPGLCNFGGPMSLVNEKQNCEDL
ncbi:Zinc finger GATA-type [Arabidopsis thaliana x Arabidopsis arenosa]|uniref:Zinc finger GATA-type n=1 Tax=Arabidopsis thaliana x Arabidopsis arenosa TaxID=1240361 RepID=A0A8T2A6T8_9BRAS|nr:Zinc finger GATA-type [Arabidopsis thaliana x Arabidopsis arenosa]KAG7568349.1 Zinc finger GATA-type [Arabidopsis thaliana x Arabidopsis arenosa]KAG7568350.1 Zinc finger GATA-type [Arabidopsis thaliana x Arabidopsis arenosa]